MTLERRLPEMYAVLALVVTGLMCLVTAPFFGPDEANQACRAIALAHGQVIARMGADEAGGEIDSGALAAMEGVNNIRMAWEKRAGDFHNRAYGPMTEELERPLAQVRWSHRRVFVPFGNTAAYPPFLYAPAVLGWRVGEALGLTIFESLRLARMLCALTAVAVGWLAMRVCARSRWLLLPFLLLPSVLFINATCSQDAVLLPVAALVAALVSRPLVRGGEWTHWELAGVAGLVATMAMARPPYLGLALILFLPGVELAGNRWRRWLEPMVALALVVGAVALWRHAVAGLDIDTSDEANPTLQMLFMQAHPGAAAWAIVRGTVEAAVDFWQRGFYVVGWNDLLGPRVLSIPAGLCVIAGLLLGERGPVRSWRGTGLTAVCVGAALLGISAAEYLIWTPPGLSTVYGIQPRYWLPVMPLGMMLLQGAIPMPIPPRLRERLLAGMLVVLLAIACTLPLVAQQAFYRDGWLARW